VACSITDPDGQTQALTAAARVLAQAGRYERAETVARSITDPSGQARALTEMAGELAQAGRYEQAETVARSITDPSEQAQALTAVARALVAGEARGRHGTSRRRRMPSDGGPQCCSLCCRLSPRDAGQGWPASAGRDRGPLHQRPVLAGAGAGGGSQGAGRGRRA
jgi:hypothetical protein